MGILAWGWGGGRCGNQTKAKKVDTSQVNNSCILNRDKKNFEQNCQPEVLLWHKKLDNLFIKH